VGAVNLQRRLEGARSVLDRHPGIQVVEVYDIKEDPVRCAEIIASGTNRYPDLGAWISVGGWPVFTRNALQAVDPARTKFISFDTIPPAPDLLREGKVQVLIGQKYFGWGSESVGLLADIKAGKRAPSPIVDSGVDVVTAANVDDYAGAGRSSKPDSSRDPGDSLRSLSEWKRTGDLCAGVPAATPAGVPALPTG
jgi:ribose transport system substrate-binding protein